MCRYNVDRLKQQVDFLKAADIVTLCVFRSTQENVKKVGRGRAFGTYSSICFAC